MKILVFAKRNLKEIIRDPIALLFSIALPIVLLIIFQQFDIPASVYKIENFAPAIIVFGFSFLTLFTATLVAKDRETSLLARLYASPMKPQEYIMGYTIAVIPVALIQIVAFYVSAVFIGLEITIGVLISALVAIPISLLFIILGVLIGTITNTKQAPAVASLIIQFVSFTSGMWFDIQMVGGFFAFVCNILPFKYTLSLVRMSLNSQYENTLLVCLAVVAYIILAYVVTTILFKSKMKKV